MSIVKSPLCQEAPHSVRAKVLERKWRKRGLGGLSLHFHRPLQRGLRFPRSWLSQVRGEKDHFRGQGLLRPAIHCR